MNRAVTRAALRRADIPAQRPNTAEGVFRSGIYIFVRLCRTVKTMTPYVVVVLASVALILIQEVTGVEPQAALAGIVSAVLQALTVGGGIALAGNFLLKEIGKRLDYQREAQKEEADLQRAERERQFTQYKDLFSSYVAQQDRAQQAMQAQVDRLIAALDGERTRYDTMVTKLLTANGEKQGRSAPGP